MPPLKAALAAAALAGVLLLGVFAAPFVLDAGPALRASDLEGLVAAKLPAPPTLRLLSPEDGQGAGGRVRVAGEAASESSAILDVQYRLDGAPWSSLPGVVAGAPLSVFQAEVPAPPGDHVLEVRAWDGNAHSLVARAHFRAAPVPPPTVRILRPLDGEGVAAGPVVVSGTVESAVGAPRVLVSGAGQEAEADVTPGPGGVASWRATLDLPEGLHVLSARADGSLPARVPVAAAAQAPPTLRVLRPDNASAFGSGGEGPCRCILFAGAAPGATGVLASLDGLDPEPLRLDPGGAWAWSVPVTRLLSGEHVALFTPLGEEGAEGVPRAVAFTVRATQSVRLAGDDAPRPTHAPLRFRAEGENLREARWLLDGAPLAEGPEVELRLTTPGAHALVLRALDAQERAATARVALWALNQPPVATLEAPAAPVEGEGRLVARATDPDGAVVAWRWDFGDETTATTTTGDVTHRWPHAGTFRVRATPVDDRGLEGAPASALVAVLNGDPLAAFSFEPAAPTVLDAVTFRDASADPERRLVAWRWDFGDGDAAEGPVASHRFATRGTHLVTLRVVDADGGQDTALRAVHVRNLAPTPAFLHEPQAPRTGAEVLFADRSLDLDGRVVSWRWDFGHACAAPCDALRAPQANGSRVLHAFPAPGTYLVNLTVEDDAGALAHRALEVVVADGAPLVRKATVEPQPLHARQEARFRADAADPEGKNLSLAWDFGDGNASRDREPAHAYARSGLYQAALVARDPAGQETRLAFPVLVHNAKPNATLRLPQPPFAGYAAYLDALAHDPDGRVVRLQFDADGDGLPECDGNATRCPFTWPRPGLYNASLAVADDEGASVRVDLQVEVQAPPAHLTPPDVLVEAPAPDALLTGRVLLQGAARGEAPIRRVEIQLRNATWTLSAGRDAWTQASGNETWRIHLDTRAFPDGEYELVVRATDARGVAGHAWIPLAVANDVPPGSLVSLQLHDPPKAPLRADAEVRGSAWHPDGPVTVRWQIDEGPWRDAPGDPAGFTIPLRVSDLGPGPHLLRVDARRGPLQRALEVLPFRVADAPPALVVDEPPTPIAYGLLAASGRLVGEGRVLWRLDHDVWRELPAGPEWRLAFETQRVRGGPHDLWLKAESLDGAEETEPVSYHVRVVNPVGATEEDRRLLERLQAPEPLPDEVDLAEEARKDVPLGMLPLAVLAVVAVTLRRRW